MAQNIWLIYFISGFLVAKIRKQINKLPGFSIGFHSNVAKNVNILVTKVRQ